MDPLCFVAFRSCWNWPRLNSSMQIYSWGNVDGANVAPMQTSLSHANLAGLKCLGNGEAESGWMMSGDVLIKKQMAGGSMRRCPPKVPWIHGNSRKIQSLLHREWCLLSTLERGAYNSKRIITRNDRFICSYLCWICVQLIWSKKPAQLVPPNSWAIELSDIPENTPQLSLSRSLMNSPQKCAKILIEQFQQLIDVMLFIFPAWRFKMFPFQF